MVTELLPELFESTWRFVEVQELFLKFEVLPKRLKETLLFLTSELTCATWKIGELRSIKIIRTIF